MVCFMLLGLGAGLRGEEVPLVNLEGLLTFWMETRADEDRYMMITLQGRFKGEVDSAGTSCPSATSHGRVFPSGSGWNE